MNATIVKLVNKHLRRVSHTFVFQFKKPYLYAKSRKKVRSESVNLIRVGVLSRVKVVIGSWQSRLSSRDRLPRPPAAALDEHRPRPQSSRNGRLHRNLNPYTAVRRDYGQRCRVVATGSRLARSGCYL